MASSNSGLKPLKISCTSTDCANDLHCFQRTKKLTNSGKSGQCRECGAQLVDWSRLHQRNVADVSYTFEALRFELIRHHFWHISLSEYAVNYARRKGHIALREAVRKQIEHAVGSPNHPAQGRQTPRETNPRATAVHYAQHATASCCRKCLEEWHGIPVDVDLTSEQLEYLTELAMCYIDARIPDLSDEPVSVPRRSAGRVLDSSSSATNRLRYAS